MNKIKNVLVERHIGAVLIGLILSQGVAGLAAVILSPLQNAMARSHASVYDRFPPVFSPYELVVGSARAAVMLAIGLLLLKWLYLPKEEAAEEEAEVGES